MTELPTAGRRPFLFLALVLLLSVPLYALGNRQVLPAAFHLYAPAFVFATAIPLLLANLLHYRERGLDGVKALWVNVFEAKRIKNKLWFIPILLLMPAVLTAGYVLALLIGNPILHPSFPILIAPVLFVAFFVLAIGEEAGWSGYVIDGLQENFGALTSSIVLGVVWAAWHVIPFLQAHHASRWWVVWQCAGCLPLRVLMVWIFNNTRKSLLAMVLFHATINESEFMYPNLGSHYDPFLSFLLLTVAASAVVYLWGSATLARYRFRRTAAIAKR